MIELCASTQFVKKKEDAFMKKMKSLLGSMLGYGFLFGIVLLIVFVLACFGGVIMHFFGFYYESVWKLMLFFILSGLVGLPLELLAKGVPKALLAFNKISTGFARGIFFILDVLSTMVSMILVDYFMESVSATLRSVVVIAVIIAIPSVKDIGKPKKESTEL